MSIHKHIKSISISSDPHAQWATHTPSPYLTPPLSVEGLEMDMDMDASWRDDHDLTTGAGTGASTSTSRMIWTTSEANGELGLAPSPAPLALVSSSSVEPDLSHPSSSFKKRTDPPLPLPLPLPIAVWAKVMDTSKGRDKVLKCVQYSLRTYLYLLGLIAAVRPLRPWFRSNVKRMRLATSSLSLARKCLLLLNPLHPLTHLLSPTPTSAPTLLRHLIDLSSALADDTYCLSRLGIVSRRTGRQADRWANRFWLLTTLLGLWKVYTTIPCITPALESGIPETGERERERERERREKVEEDAKWTAYKLWSDLFFVSYDVFNLSWLKEPVQCAAGMTSALISTSKLYDQHWLASASTSAASASVNANASEVDGSGKS